MLVFASSDKGGTGRSVTTCNLAHQLSKRGRDVVYVDFDFGSPTAGAIFEVGGVERGTDVNGLHSYVRGGSEFRQVEVREETSRRELRTPPAGAGRLVLIPGEKNGAEFGMAPKERLQLVARTESLLADLSSEFDVCIVDLSAGRSTAVELALRALAGSKLAAVEVRWLLFHRWTRQHVLAAHGLLYEERGIMEIAKKAQHDEGKFLEKIRTIRTAVPDLRTKGFASGANSAQATWLQTCDEALNRLAREHRLGQGIMLGSTPMEPMLLWREQIILDSDVQQGFAAKATLAAFEKLASDLMDPRHWEGLP